MRILLFILCMLAVTPAFALKDEEYESKKLADMEERSIRAAELFRKTCFQNYSDRDKLVAFLDASYKRVPPEDSVETLNFLQSQGGELWTATISPRFVYTVASELNGACHVITPRSSAEILHKEIKNLALDVQDSMSFTVVDYKGVTPDKLIQNSKFDAKAPDGSVILIVSAATKTNPDTRAAEGVITLIPGKK